MDPNVIKRVSLPKEPNFIEDLQVQVLNKLLDMSKINEILANQRQFGAKAYSLVDYMATIHKGIWKDLNSGKPIDPYRRGLQKSYVGAMQDILGSNKPAVTETDVYSIARADFIRLLSEIHSAIPGQTDDLSRYHLLDLEVRIKNTLEAKRTMQ
jgi:hypothetical protein